MLITAAPRSSAAATFLNFNGATGNPYIEGAFTLSGQYGINGAANCPFDDPACIQVSSATGNTTDLALTAGGTFTLTDFVVSHVGGGSGTLEVYVDDAFVEALTISGLDQTVSGKSYTGVKVSFYNASSSGNVFIDNVVATPIPAAALLMMSGLAGLGAYRRSKQKRDQAT
jgi:hypothetical protein